MNYDAMAEDLKLFVEKVVGGVTSSKPIVIGHSMGGKVC